MDSTIDINSLSPDLTLPDFPDNIALNALSYEDTFWDSRKIDNFNDTIIKTVMNLNELTKQMNLYSQKKVKTELEYKHKYRYLMITLEAKTEAQKKQIAELNCEKLEIKLAYYNEILKELSQKSNQLRTELDILKTIGFNIRQELKL